MYVQCTVYTCIEAVTVTVFACDNNEFYGTCLKQAMRNNVFVPSMFAVYICTYICTYTQCQLLIDILCCSVLRT